MKMSVTSIRTALKLFENRYQVCKVAFRETGLNFFMKIVGATKFGTFDRMTLTIS
jgi:hypothetical protein